jgi:23S rRNA (uracil1939-C5)-methyltransferase
VSRRARYRKLSLAVTECGPEMQGLAAAQGREVLVRGGLPGEDLDAEVVKRHRGKWFARPVVWHQQSARRRPPPCPAFPTCGGCAAQHLSTSDQLAWKQQQLLLPLAGAGVTPARVRSPVTGPQFHYRRKARLAVRYLAPKDEILVGFREAYSSKIARIEGCPVLVRPFAELLQPLAVMLAHLSIRAAIPQVEFSAGDDHAVLILRHLAPLTAADRARLRSFQSRYRIGILLQDAGYDSIADLDGQPPPLLHYRLDRFGVDLAFDAADFVQVNAEINAALVHGTLDALDLRREDRVLDLFCGIGNFTLPVARSGIAVTGVEANPALVARARHNAQRNGVAGFAAFSEADLYQQPPAAIAADFNKAIVDPPRTGAGSAIELLCSSEVERVAYVSCHPESFVKDSLVLTDAGYEFSEVCLFDMFPQTSHVETLGVFCRR